MSDEIGDEDLEIIRVYIITPIRNIHIVVSAPIVFKLFNDLSANMRSSCRRKMFYRFLLDMSRLESIKGKEWRVLEVIMSGLVCKRLLPGGGGRTGR